MFFASDFADIPTLLTSRHKLSQWFLTWKSSAKEDPPRVPNLYWVWFNNSPRVLEGILCFSTERKATKLPVHVAIMMVQNVHQPPATARLGVETGSTSLAVSTKNRTWLRNWEGQLMFFTHRIHNFFTCEDWQRVTLRAMWTIMNWRPTQPVLFGVQRKNSESFFSLANSARKESISSKWFDHDLFHLIWPK